MTTSSSTNLGLSLPGATTNDKRLVDMQAIKSSLVSLDTIITNNNSAKADVNGNVANDFSVKKLTVAGDILPTVNSVQNIGSPTQRFKGIYVDEAHLSVNTLYLGDTPILGTSADTINIKADPGQSINIKTSGIGSTLMTSETGIIISSTGADNDVLVQAQGIGGQVRFGANQSVELTSPNVNVNGNQTVSGNQTVTGGLTVTGSLTVNGAVTSVNSTTVTTKDNIIELNKGQVGAGVSAGKAGLSIDRGDEPAYQMVFDEADDMFKVGMVGSLQTIASQNFVTANAAPLVHVHSVATTSVSGFMSATDKSTLDGLGANNTAAITAAIGTEITARNAAIAAEATARDAAIVTGVAAEATARNTAVSNEATARATAVSTSATDTIATLKGTATVAGDTLGKLQSLITGFNTGTNTGDETTSTIKSKLGIATLTGSNTGDQILPTTLPASDVSAWAKAVTKPSYTAAEVGLANVDNTTDLNKPISTATQSALNAKLDAGAKAASAVTADSVAFSAVTGKPTTLAGYSVSDAYTKTETDSRIQAIVGAAPVALDTLVEIAAQLAADETAATALTNSVALKAPLASPTFTGTVSGITSNMVGLGNVDNTTDSAKPVSTAQATADTAVQTAAAADATTKANAAQAAAQAASAPSTHVGAGATAHAVVVSGGAAGFMTGADKTKLDTITGNNTGDQVLPTTLPASDVYAWAKSATKPTYTAAEVGLTNVNNTSDANKPVSIAQEIAMGSKANLAAPTITGLKETKVAVAASAIDLNTGNLFSKTVAGALTWSVSNIPAAGTVASFMLDLTNGGAAAQTWWAGVKWAGGTAPTLTAAGRDTLGFFTHDGGTTWTGLVLGKDIK